ncbi:hypothetical protein ACIQPQ_13135 [Streptomyces sp. NPDC091281]|uniref:hypothetical protein n=1 Tax=Streptomyces sp. NPDC091281 TaxID=3365985 RepID=UPI00381377F4
MSWQSVIILVPEGQRASLEARFHGLDLNPDPVTGAERPPHQDGYAHCFDLSGHVLTDYAPEKLAEVRDRIGAPYAALVEYPSVDAARTVLRRVLPGVHGLVDTDHHEILRADDFLTLLDRFPDWDWHHRPSTELL